MSVFSFQSLVSSAKSNISCVNSLRSTAFQRRYRIDVHPVKSKKPASVTFSICSKIGQGTFGEVFLINLDENINAYSKETKSGRYLAMKQILRSYKRELYIHRNISKNHPNIVQLDYYFFYGPGKALGLIMEYMPENLHNLVRRYKTRGKKIPDSTIEIFMKYILSGLQFLHSSQIMHRDIKSQNVLVDIDNWKVKLADFGTSKEFKAGNINYTEVGSRFYRAPELLCGNENYDFAIDIWSAAIVFMDMIIVEPLFQGRDNTDQLIEIFTILGHPNDDELLVMECPSDPNINKDVNILHLKLDLNENGNIINLLKLMLRYNFHERITAANALRHEYFLTK